MTERQPSRYKCPRHLCWLEPRQLIYNDAKGGRRVLHYYGCPKAPECKYVKPNKWRRS